jgi:hypothetical protein
MLYAICYSTGEKLDKTATLQSGSLTLRVGAIVAVKFVAVNTADKPRINIGGSGLLPIYLGTTPLTSQNALWKENAIINLVYNIIKINGEDKGVWEIVNGSELEYIKEFNAQI